MANLSEFNEILEARISDLRDDIISRVSTLASQDEILALKKLVGHLEGIKQTKDDLDKVVRGDTIEGDDV